MTKEMSRTRILNYLSELMEKAELRLADAKEYIEKHGNSNLEGHQYHIEHYDLPTIKYGTYFAINDLHEEILKAMEIAPIRIERYKERISYASQNSYSSSRTVIREYPIYSDEAHAIAKTVISRMAQQEFIRISKSGRGFKVLKAQ